MRDVGIMKSACSEEGACRDVGQKKDRGHDDEFEEQSGRGNGLGPGKRLRPITYVGNYNES
jgi:hypothetical protein